MNYYNYFLITILKNSLILYVLLHGEQLHLHFNRKDELEQKFPLLYI